MAPPTASAKRTRGRPRRDERPPDASRHELLDAAEAVFTERGFERASVDEVVRRAGLSKGTFYWNFENKEDLFLALVEDRIDRPARDAAAAVTASPVGARPAADLSQALAQLYSQERAVVLLLHEFGLLAARDPDLAKRHRARQRSRRQFLASVLAARHDQTGVPLAVPAEDLAEAFLALADGLALRVVIDPRTVSPALFGEIASLVYDGMVHRVHG